MCDQDGAKNRYYLIACGTSNYEESSDWEPLPSVQEDIGRVVELLTNNFGYERILKDVSLTNSGRDLKVKFTTWLQDKDRSKNDVVIFYYSGHGEYVQGNKHYLILEDTNPQQVPITALATDDLILPLMSYEDNWGNTQEAKISQILYIIDTCYSQSGAGNIISLAESLIQQYKSKKSKEKPIQVYAIAASRAGGLATVNVFSQAFEEVLKNLTPNEVNSGYFPLESLVDKINQKISFELQRAVGNSSGYETTAKFFPIIPETLQTWEEKREELIGNLFSLLKRNDKSLYCVNSFILTSNLVEEFIVDEVGLRDKLSDLALRPAYDDICPLIACSERCRQIFQRKIEKNNNKLVTDIENWQREVIVYRSGVDLEKTKKTEQDCFNKFKQLITQGGLRIQTIIEPQVDQENNTGLPTGAFVVNMNLYLLTENDEYMLLVRLAEDVVLNLSGYEPESLLAGLKNNDFLANLIQKMSYTLDYVFSKSVNPPLEFFLPFDYWSIPLETIEFQYTVRLKRELHRKFIIFINSFERYFDEDNLYSREDIQVKKEKLWGQEKEQPSVYFNITPETVELEDFEIYDVYIGTSPSIDILAFVEATLPIAVWSRNTEQELLNSHFSENELPNWPRILKDLRGNGTHQEVTLFWDDLYPKPCDDYELFNTNMVD